MFALQLVKFRIVGVAFAYVSLLGIYSTLESNGDIGLSVNFYHGIEMAIQSGGGIFIALNIFVIPIIAWLLRASPKPD